MSCAGAAESDAPENLRSSNSLSPQLRSRLRVQQATPLKRDGTGRSSGSLAVNLNPPPSAIMMGAFAYQLASKWFFARILRPSKHVQEVPFEKVRLICD